MQLSADQFAGVWHLSRVITDHQAGLNGRLIGTAQFVDGGDRCLTYQEEGQLQLGTGPVMQARRVYMWRFSDTLVEVQFENGAPFHRFTPSGHGPGTDHPCGEDYYTVRYDFRRWPVWQAVWRVQGPRKDYISVSDYSR